MQQGTTLPTAGKPTRTGRIILTDTTHENIAGVRVLDPSRETDRIADAVFRDGFLHALLPPSREPTGLWLIPGIVDMHVHLRVPGGEEAETLSSGLEAAVAGGVVTLGMMPNTDPPLDRVPDTMRLAAEANSMGLCTVQPVPCVTLGRQGRELVDMAGFAGRGVTAFSDDGSPVEGDEMLFEAYRQLSAFSGTLIEHPEVTSMASGGAVNLGLASKVTGAGGIPESAEYEDVKRCIEILEKSPSGAKLHLTHLSSPRSVELAASAALRGFPVTCDITPHHMSMNEEDLIRLGPLAKMNPPLRSEESRRKLVELAVRGMITAVASDHAPHTAHSKNKSLQDSAFGITGLETLLPVTVETLVSSGGMAPLKAISMLTSNPSRILGVPFHGITTGDSCRMVLFDPEAVWTYEKTRSRSCNSPFLGRRLRGRVLRVWIGREVYREGEFV